MQLLIDAPKAQTSNYRFVNNNTLTFKVHSTLLAPRVYFANSKPCSSMPLPNSKVTCYNYGQTGHYASVCTSLRKPSADL